MTANQTIFTNDFNNTADASGFYPGGITTVTWTVEDGCGNSATCQMTVEVECFHSNECCDEDNNLITNGGFDGLPGGNVTTPHAPWSSGGLSPQVNNNDGCTANGSGQLWGNQGVGEKLQQINTSGLFMANETYNISFCAAWVDINNRPPNLAHAWVNVRAANGTVTDQNCGSGTCIGVSQVLDVDGQWEEVCFTWTPDANYDRIVFNTLNASSANHGDSVSWARIDDVCISKAEPSYVCCADSVAFCDLVDLGFTVAIDPNDGCTVTATAPQFDSCHWFGSPPDFGAGDPPLQVITDPSGSWTYTYPQSGTYDICVTVYEGDVNNLDPCFQKQMCTTVTVECPGDGCVDVLEVTPKGVSCTSDSLCINEPFCLLWMRNEIQESLNNNCGQLFYFNTFRTGMWGSVPVIIGNTTGAPDGAREVIFDCSGNIIQDCEFGVGVNCTPDAGINISNDITSLTTIWTCPNPLPPLPGNCTSNGADYHYCITLKNDYGNGIDQIAIDAINLPGFVSFSPNSFSPPFDYCDTTTIDLTIHLDDPAPGDTLKLSIGLIDSMEVVCLDTLCLELPPCDTIPPDDCCDDFDEFCDQVDAGFSQIISGFDITVLPIDLDSCHQVTWLWGDGTNDGVFTAFDMVTHTYNSGGMYQVCMVVSEINEQGEACWVKEHCEFIAISSCVPTLVCPEDIEADCCGPVDLPDPVFTDDCPEPHSTSCEREDGLPLTDDFGIGQTCITCYLQNDATGIVVDSCSYCVNVTDNPPMIVCETTLTAVVDANCSYVLGDLTGTVTVSDDCTPASSLVITQNPAPGTVLPLGIHILTFTVTDNCGQESSCDTELVLQDPVPPVLTCPADATIIAQCDTMGIFYNFNPPVAFDNCGNPIVVCDHQPGDFLPLGTTTICCTATDDFGNTNQCCWDVTVEDNPDCCDDFDGFCNQVDQGFSASLFGTNLIVQPIGLTNINLQVEWNWGDGNSSCCFDFDDITNHFYAPGSYTVCMIVTEFNDNGDVCWVKEICQNIQVVPDDCCIPEADYCALFEMGISWTGSCDSLKVWPNLLDSCDIISWSLDGVDLDDITTGTDPLCITPIEAGTHFVCMTASREDGNGNICIEKDTCFMIMLPDFCGDCCLDDSLFCAQVDTGFVAASACEKLTVVPIGLDDCDEVTWTWGDGSVGPVSVGNTLVQHTYEILPVPVFEYEVCMTVRRYDLFGAVCNEKTYCEIVQIENCCECDDQFFMDASQGFGVNQIDECSAELQHIALDDECDQVEWSVNFTTPLGTSMGNDPFTANFSANGQYTVCYIVTRTTANGETCQAEDCLSIEITDCDEDCNCTNLADQVAQGFDWEEECGEAIFTPMDLLEDCDQITWDFGDQTPPEMSEGNASILHTYDSPGDYTVCMTVTRTTPSGTVCTETYCETLSISSFDNLVDNGDFEDANGTFTTDLSQNCGCAQQSYCISNLATNKCPNGYWTNVTDPSGTGNFLIVDGWEGTSAQLIWSQSFADDTVGELCYLALDFYPNVSDGTSPTLSLKVGDGNTSQNSYPIFGVLDEWNHYTYSFVPNSSPVFIEIYQENPATRNDYGLDNIYFGHCPPACSCASLQAAITEGFGLKGWCRSRRITPFFELKECDEITVDWGDGSPVDMFDHDDMLNHTYPPGIGTYNACMTIERPEQGCSETICETVIINCIFTPYDLMEELIPDGGFTEVDLMDVVEDYQIGGQLTDDSGYSLPKWDDPLGNAQIVLTEGYGDEHFLRLSGTSSQPAGIGLPVEIIDQDNPTIVYHVQGLVRIGGNSDVSAHRLKVVASLEPLEADGSCDPCEIILNETWPGDTPPSWMPILVDSWKPDQAYEYLTFLVEAEGDDSEFSAVLDLDNLGMKKDTVISTFEKHFQYDVAIYPNPTDGQLNIDFTQPLSADLELSFYDVIGRKVLAQSLSRNGGDSFSIDTGRFSSGVYILELKDAAGGVLREKIVVSQ